jgi:hypothetical protein
MPAANCAVAIAAAIALVATAGHAAEVSKSENIGPWEIEAMYKGDQFDRCSINRSLQDDIVARFVRTSHRLTLELESPNWTLERGKNYPVKMTMGTLSLDTEVAAEPDSVSVTIDDKKFENALRDASALNIIAAGATIRVPLDKSTVAFDELAQCVEKNATTVVTTCSVVHTWPWWLVCGRANPPNVSKTPACRRKPARPKTPSRPRTSSL